MIIRIGRTVWPAVLLFACAGVRGDIALEEVIVTAQKREQSFTDVPVSVTQFGEHLLAATNTTEFKELAGLAPGLTIVGPRDGFGQSIKIRGVGQEANSENIPASVGVFVDGVPLASLRSAFGGLIDLERVEVLKGPQSTLYGKEVSSGAISIHTRAPELDRIDASVSGRFGNKGYEEYRGTVGFPLGDRLAARLALYATETEGQVTNLYTGRAMSSEATGGSLRVLYQPSDAIEVILSHREHRGEMRDAVRERLEYGLTSLSFADIYGDELLEADPYDRKVDTNGAQGRDVHNALTYLHFNGALNSHWGVHSVTGYQAFNHDFDKGRLQRGASDGAVGRYGILTSLYSTDIDAFSQEVRLDFQGDSLVSTLGVFYEHREVTFDVPILTRLVVAGEVSEFPLWFYSDEDERGYSLFSHNSYAINENWEVVAGLRYSRTRKLKQEANIYLAGDFGPRPFDPSTLPVQRGDFEGLGGTLKMLYHLESDISFYFGVDRGFKAGGFNRERLPGFDPEIATNWELGFKGEAFDRRVRWSLSVYRQFYDDFQVVIPDPVFSNIIANASEVTASGVDFELQWQLTEGLNLNVDWAYNLTRYEAYASAECNDLQVNGLLPGCIDGVQDLSGERVPYSPLWSANLGLDYRGRIPGSSWSWQARGDLVYRDKMRALQNSDPRSEIAASTLLNTRIALVSPGERWELFLWGKNLTDEDYLLSVEPGSDGPLGLLSSIGDERSAGLGIEYRLL